MNAVNEICWACQSEHHLECEYPECKCDHVGAGRDSGLYDKANTEARSVSDAVSSEAAAKSSANRYEDYISHWQTWELVDELDKETLTLKQKMLFHEIAHRAGAWPL